MKSLFPRFPTRIWVALLAMLPGMYCYSAEFFPTSDYPNLRGPGDQEVEVRLSPPHREYRELGTLLIRNFSGDLRDETFQAFLRREIRKRGARGGWIVRRRFHRQVQYETGTVSRSRPGAFSPTGEIKSTVGILKVVLYNYVE